jgi:predicted PurR-regulated permease PerM
MTRERIIVLFFFGLLALVSYELYQVIYPFITPIAWAILLAFLAHPALIALNHQIRSRSICALILTLAVALGVILPAVALSTRLVHEAQSLYSTLAQTPGAGGLAKASDWIRETRLGARVDLALAHHGVKLEDEISYFAVQAAKATSDYIVKNGSTVASNIIAFLFHFAIALITFFYLLRDGEAWYAGVRELTPLHEQDKAAIFETLQLTLSSVMRGLMLTALLDGLALGLGYLVLGIPYWELLALASAAAGLLPLGGTALVWVPVAGYLVFTSGWSAAAILLIWAAIVLTIIDNLVKPLAMGHGTDLPTVGLFFGLAGGIEAYGPLGIFAGPAVVATFAALIRAYRRTYVRGQTAVVPQTATVAPTSSAPEAIATETPAPQAESRPKLVRS